MYPSRSINGNFYGSIQALIDIAELYGATFEVSSIVNLAAGVSTTNPTTSPIITKDEAGYSFSIFKTGSSPVILYGRALSYNGVGVYAYVYRDPIYTGGTDITDAIRNPNDINPKTSEVTGKTGILGTNISSLGEETRAPSFIFGNTSNQGAGAVLQTISTPQYIGPNKEYLLILKNISNAQPQIIGSHIRWIELDRIPGLIIQNGQFVAYNGVRL